MRFNRYINEYNDIDTLLELYFFIEYHNRLDESLDFGKLLSKMGFHVKKGKGLIQTMKSASKGVKDLIWYTFKLYQGNEEYRDKIIDLYKSVNKEDVIDILLRLDMLTLHAVTGPIHMLDAITGWHLAPNLKRKVTDIKDRVQRVIDHLSTIRKEYTDDKVKKEVDKMLNQFKELFPL